MFLHKISHRYLSRITAFIFLIMSAVNPVSVMAAELEIDAKSIVVADKSDYLIIVIDLKPYQEVLARAEEKTHELIVSAAQNQAEIYLAKEEFSSRKKATVYLIAVESMDEYARANFDGMVRYGTLKFDRSGTSVTLREDKLTYK